MSDNQRYYILHHIKWTDFYDDMPQQNKKYPKLVDNRDEIINDMINDFDVWQASRLIEDIVDEQAIVDALPEYNCEVINITSKLKNENRSDNEVLIVVKHK